MALVRGKVNPLNVLGMRRLNHIPPHFASLTIKKNSNFDEIENWMYTNLDSRFCIKKGQSIDEQNKLIDIIEIGVEDPKELSMLLLGCPYFTK
jgi:hypothetical protein